VALSNYLSLPEVDRRFCVFLTHYFTWDSLADWRASFDLPIDIDASARCPVQLVPMYAQAVAEHMREQEV
jgi:hypothetical protein